VDNKRNRQISLIKEHYKTRFENFDPNDFEDFISQLFRDLGYFVEQTPYSGDHGVDALATKENKKTAIQIKRYNINNHVGVKEINQALGGMSYYKCDKSLVITTSSFTHAAINHSYKTDIELWDWDKLKDKLLKTYFNKETLEKFEKYLESENVNLNNEPTISDTIKIEFDKMQRKKLRGGDVLFLISFNITNITDRSVLLNLNKPIIRTHDKKQIESIRFEKGFFSKGVIESLFSVIICIAFDDSQYPSPEHGDTIIFTSNIGDF
jgi:hypothetical protein